MIDSVEPTFLGEESCKPKLIINGRLLSLSFISLFSDCTMIFILSGGIVEA